MLGWKASQNGIDLLMGDLFIDSGEDIRLAKIPIIFWDLIFQNKVISESIPSQIRQYAVILMPVSMVVRKHNIRVKPALQFFEGILDQIPLRRKIALAIITNLNL